METPDTRILSISAGDHRIRVLAARDALVVSHLHIVLPIARSVKKNQPTSVEIDDLVGQGYLGLLSAAIRFRPREHGGCPFAVYAVRRIRGAMTDSIRRRHYTTNRMLPLPAEHGPAAVPEEDIDRARTLKRLRSKFAQLTDKQRLVLGAWYQETTQPPQRAAWKRLERIRRMHDATLETLREDLRAA